MRKLFWAAASLFLALSVAGAASAQTHRYDFTGHFNNVSGNLTGHFTYNLATDTFTDVFVATTAGAGPGGPTPATTYTVLLRGSTDSLKLLEGPAGPGQKVISFAFSPALYAANPAIFNASEGTCPDTVCVGPSFNRTTYVTDTFTRTEVVTSVPTLSEWAMILLGLTLAGGAALYIQHRRLTA